MTKTTIRTEYLERELVQIALPQSYVVSDHPVAVGGTGRGPSPGEILLAAYTAETVFGVRDKADKLGLQINPITVRCSFQPDREKVDGPLTSLGFLRRITRRIEIGSLVPIDDLDQFSVTLGIHKALESGISIEERVEFLPGDKDIRDKDWVNANLRASDADVAQLYQGSSNPGTEETKWRVSASEIAPNLALVNLAGAPMLVSRNGSMNCPSPHDLFLASLATCTTIYVARNAHYCDAPIADVAVETTAEKPVSLDDPIRLIEKVSFIAGNLSPKDAENCKFFSDFCAIGETLKRGVEIVGDVILTHYVPNSGQAATTAFAEAAPPSELLCDDGQCCV
ncbi:MAG: hypothetical protein EOP84_25820 [Verrucomicrobiaceae bacterium]|nr:MAG: hypothetical protein EOP84_25820 [Verrucomicrobiaceae bacterium]